MWGELVRQHHGALAGALLAGALLAGVTVQLLRGAVDGVARTLRARRLGESGAAMAEFVIAIGNDGKDALKEIDQLHKEALPAFRALA